MKKLLQYLAIVIITILPIYYFRFQVLGLPTNPIELLVLLLFIMTLVTASKAIIGSPLLKDYGWLIGLLLLGILIGCLISPDKRVGFGILKGWFVIPLFYALSVSALFNRKDYSWLIMGLGINV